LRKIGCRHQHNKAQAGKEPFLRYGVFVVAFALRDCCEARRRRGPVVFCRSHNYCKIRIHSDVSHQSLRRIGGNPAKSVEEK
jgi:hypothetical protein